MGMRELVSYLRRRAPEVEEVLEGVGYTGDDLNTAIHRPNPDTRSHRTKAEEEARAEALWLASGGTILDLGSGQVDPGLEAMGGAVSVHPGRGTAEAMGEAWNAQRVDEAPAGVDSCADCRSVMTGIPCHECQGCGECCMCHSAGLLDVGLI